MERLVTKVSSLLLVLSKVSLAQDGIIIENVKEWQGVTLKDSSGNELATLSGRTAWKEVGYAHAKQYELDFIITAETTA